MQIQEQKTDEIIWLVEAVELLPNESKGYIFIKRTFDLCASIFALIALAPLFLLVSIAIKIEDPKGTVFYHQPRIGKNGKVFICHKFRSMYSNADFIKASLMQSNEMDGPVFKMRNDPRVTRVGKIIRRLSIDELPQLWNIIVNEMSIIGPRPLIVEEELACNSYQRQRELVKPGLSCYWQIEGRNDIMFDEWIELDRKYIREQSVITDLNILIRTFGAVIKGKGAV